MTHPCKILDKAKESIKSRSLVAWTETWGEGFDQKQE